MFKVVTLDDYDNWNEIVRSFRNYDVYYLPDYVKGFEIIGDGVPLLFYFENKTMRAMNVVMRRDIASHKNFNGILPKDTFFDLSTPYGYGGFVFEGEYSKSDIVELNKEYTKYCIKNNIVSEFVRFHPILENDIYLKSMYQVVKLGKTVTINLDSRIQIWNEFSSKNRNVIRKAKKMGVEIFCTNDRKMLDTFLPMYNATMAKDNAASYYYFNRPFYDSIINDLRNNMLFFYAVLEGQIVSIAMVIYANKKLNYHLSASNPEFNRFSPSNLLLSQIALYGVENNFESFHLGGGLGSSEDSLFKFKKAFNRNSETYFSIGKKIFDMDLYNKLVAMNGRTDEVNFFPEYRA
ncbi:peptidoglycan bridge formation glycyltransferase FemA/FemB family protein [Aerococcus urinaeequi]|uniref:peptidoglycan bridge formation glycyltransferase FemA/FemB family protein n=1 Tax=Aerococcus urinaeequi TaxID=51665 RepID=UPI003B4F5535